MDMLSLFVMDSEPEDSGKHNWIVDLELKSFKDYVRTFRSTVLLVGVGPQRHGLIHLVVWVATMVLVPATGCEAFSELVYHAALVWLVNNSYYPRVKVRSVEVREHGANSAIYLEEKFITTENHNEEPKNPQQATVTD